MDGYVHIPDFGEAAVEFKDDGDLNSYCCFGGSMAAFQSKLEEVETRLRRAFAGENDQRLKALAYSSLGQNLILMGRFDAAQTALESSLPY